VKIAIIALTDAAIVAFSSIMPLVLRFGIFSLDAIYFQRALICLPVDVLIAIAALVSFKLYSRVWSFAGVDELIAVTKATLVIEAVYLVYHLAIPVFMPRSYYVFQWTFLFILISGSRLSIRFYRMILKRNRPPVGQVSTMIVGAGSAAAILINEIKYRPTKYRITCIVDDNKSKRGKYISGIHIEGNRFDIPALAEKYDVEEIIIAMPSATAGEIREVITIADETDARIKILPTYTKASTSSISSAIREVNYEDLLMRNSIEIDNEELADFINDKIVMVTGAGGSIGSELCRQIVANRPKKLIMLDIYENNIYEVAEELERRYKGANTEIIELIASVRDENRLRKILEEYNPQIIFHAAAHKHVPLMEDSPCEAVKNNCGGTFTLAKLANEYRVEDFVLISTDKAVRPTNVMGATKRICELIVQAMNRKSDTRFVAVRFGNVLGSNGSVIPLFLRQIEEGGPVTVTHNEVTRFFMTIREAVSLVLQAVIPNGNNELFILDMGEPVKIYDLAESLIKMKGLKPGKDVEIKVVGLRPGEKLYEELLMAEEGLGSTKNDLIFVGKPTEIDEESFFIGLDRLLKAAAENSDVIKDEIAEVCVTYTPENS
jgi:FlaA1/EpsC-like NDP-sugar epimerase